MKRVVLIMLGVLLVGCASQPARPMTADEAELLWVYRDCRLSGGGTYACERETLKWHYLNVVKPKMKEAIQQEYATDIDTDPLWDDAIAGETYIRCLQGGWHQSSRCAALSVGEWVQRSRLRTIKDRPQ
jgi:hypothetical protein